MATRVLGIVLLFCALPTMGQTERSVSEALKDAEYAFRRFDEVSARVDFSRWSVPRDLRTTEVQALKAIQTEVQNAEAILADIQTRGAFVTSGELLDVMDALSEASLELSDLSSNTLNFQDQDSRDIAKTSQANALGEELARAGATAHKAEGKLYIVLKERLAEEQLKLLSCDLKKP
ncbi:MAG: hypothetical protein LAN37_09635 [Acidobacteriia bacterium]|nr:hypothetical protein [Terriglobia bacterium]